MKRLLVVRREMARQVAETLKDMGLCVRVAGHLPATDLVFVYCCRPSETFPRAVSPKVVLEVEGHVPRRVLEDIPGVVRVRSRTKPRRGPVVHRVC